MDAGSIPAASTNQASKANQRSTLNPPSAGFLLTLSSVKG
jgi:hypothetical protein